MLKVPINDKYRITSDTHNFIIEERQKSTAKRPWKAIKFYSHIDGLLWGLFNQIVLKSSAQSVEDLRQCVKEAKSTIDSIRAAIVSNQPKTAPPQTPVEAEL